MASLIANEFTEATSDLHLSALMAVGAVLLRRHADRQRDRALARVAAWRGGERMTAVARSPTTAVAASPRARRSRAADGVERRDDRAHVRRGGARDAAADRSSSCYLLKQGAASLIARLLHQHAAARRRGRRRDGERHRRHADPHRHRVRRSGCRSASAPGCTSPSSAARGSRTSCASCRRAERAAVDRDGHLRLGVPRAADRALLGAGRRRRARRDDDSARHAHDRGDGPHRARRRCARRRSRSAIRAGARRSSIVLRTALPASSPARWSRWRASPARPRRCSSPRSATSSGRRRSTQPIAALPLQIFTYAISPYDEWHAQAWAGALVLIASSSSSASLARFVDALAITAAAATERAARRARRSPPASARRRRRARCDDARRSNAYFGSTHAVRDVSLDVPRPRGHGDHRSVGLRQVHAAALPQPDARDRAAGARRGRGAARRPGHLRARASNPIAVRRHVGMVFQRPTPFPTMSIRDNVAAGLRVSSASEPVATRDRRDRRARAAQRRRCGTR